MSSELKKLAEKHGIENLRFFMPGKLLQLVAGLAFVTVPSSEKEVIVECRADVTNTIYDMISSDHKVRLVPVDIAYGAETFYIVDFISLCAEAPHRYGIMTGEYDYVYFDQRGKVMVDMPFKPGTVIPTNDLQWSFNYRENDFIVQAVADYTRAADAKQGMRAFVRMKNLHALKAATRG